MARPSSFHSGASVARLDPTDVALVYAKFPRNGGLRPLVGAYGRDLLGAKTGSPVSFPEGVPSLGDSILVVGGFARSRKMRRVDTGRVVACMHDHHAFRDWPLHQFVGVTVRAHGFFARQQEYAVTEAIAGARPLPARRRLVSARPEHIVRPQDRMSGQAPFAAGPVIAATAKAASNRALTAYGAGNFFSRLVGHSVRSLQNAILPQNDGGYHS